MASLISIILLNILSFLLVRNFDSTDALLLDESEAPLERLKHDLQTFKFNNDDEPIRSIRGSKSRKRRQVAISFPRQSRFVTDYYMNIPTKTPLGTFMPVSLQARTTFQMPNLTFNAFTGRGLQERGLEERVSMFDTIEHFFNGFGINGRACILRTICERNEYHIVVDGLVGEVLTLLLEFSTTKEIQFQDYVEAQRIGQFEGNCAERYKCPFSIFTSWMDF